MLYANRISVEANSDIGEIHSTKNNYASSIKVHHCSAHTKKETQSKLCTKANIHRATGNHERIPLRGLRQQITHMDPPIPRSIFAQGIHF